VVSGSTAKPDPGEPSKPRYLTGWGAVAASVVLALSAISYSQGRYISGTILLVFAGFWFFTRFLEGRAHRH
jgi:hypothetical protein